MYLSAYLIPFLSSLPTPSPFSFTNCGAVCAVAWVYAADSDSFHFSNSSISNHTSPRCSIVHPSPGPSYHHFLPHASPVPKNWGSQVFWVFFSSSTLLCSLCFTWCIQTSFWTTFTYMPCHGYHAFLVHWAFCWVASWQRAIAQHLRTV